MSDPNPVPKPTVVGTWSMVEAWNIGDNPTEKTYPWGNPSSGYWVFDTSGHFSLIIYQNPPLPVPANPFPATGAPATIPGWLSPNPPWKVPYELLMESYSGDAAPYAYFGTYTVTPDANHPDAGGTLNLNPVADLMRAYTGTVQERSFRYDGYDYLNVGQPGQYLRRLKRLT